MNERAMVSRIGNAFLVFLASLLLCVAPGAPVFAAKIELADILEIDALGYRCVPTQYFDEQPDGSPAIAFSISGKTRLPRTCLPDPCARALTQQELSAITGTEPMLARFHDEWDDYYARYADHCRREVVVSRPRAKGSPNEGFWPPIISRARIIQQVGIPTSSRLRPFIIEEFGVPTTNRSTPLITALLIVPTPDLPGEGLDRPLPSPVPIPASGLMLGLALGAFGFANRRRKNLPKNQRTI